MVISNNWMDKNAGKYFLYVEDLFSGCKCHYRYFNTLKDALNHVDDIYISSRAAWRLFRSTDGKNFTSKIYF